MTSNDILKLLAERKGAYAQIAQTGLEHFTDEQKDAFIEECFEQIDDSPIEATRIFGCTAYDAIIEYHFEKSK